MEKIKTKKEKLIDEYRSEIKQLENIAKAIHSKGVVIDQTNGTVDVKLSPNQLAELVSVKSQILKMKRDMIDLEEEVDNENDE